MATAMTHFGSRTMAASMVMMMLGTHFAVTVVAWTTVDTTATTRTATAPVAPSLGLGLQWRKVASGYGHGVGADPKRFLSSPNSNDGGQGYRSIADVVGGLHGGKYQFGSPGGGTFDGASFAGHGGNTRSQEETEDNEPLPNWAQRMAPKLNSNNIPVLAVPSNANPMDGMVHSASIEIKNQERTWEKFFAKLVTASSSSSSSGDGDGRFFELDDLVGSGLSVAPRSGSLAPRGGASNACDAAQPYSDGATIRVTQAPDTTNNNNKDLWLVVGTEEEQWTYKLDLLEG